MLLDSHPTRPVQLQPVPCRPVQFGGQVSVDSGYVYGGPRWLSGMAAVAVSVAPGRNRVRAWAWASACIDGEG